MLSSVITEIRARVPSLELRENEPMSAHCSFRIGGPCAVMALPKSGAEAEALLPLLAGMGLAPLIMGNGTNLLVTDAPLDRVVVKLSDGFSEMRRDGDCVFARAGAPLSRLARFALDNSLTGLEFAHGIPGSLGGAVCMNAGAYGGEMKDVVTATNYLTSNGEYRSVAGGGHGFSYRHSVFSDGDALVLDCALRLKPGDSEAIAAKMKELAEKRRASQPLELPSAGSTFRRPKNGFAAAMIDEAGLKGVSVGGAAVSPKHAGFIVNTGGATFDDVTGLMALVRDRVFARTGVELEPEVKIIRN